MKVCLITLAKDEDSHIEEFLDHYFNIVKVDHIFWIDNNTEPLKPVVINDDRVTIIDKRSINFDSGEDEPLNIMKKLVNEVYQNYVVGSEYDWCCYFDPDELLELSTNDIQSYISQNECYDVFLMPWVMHGNNNYIWESELPSNKMKINYGYDSNYTYEKIEYKPLFRINKEYNIDIEFYDIHKIILNCDADKIMVCNDCKLHHYRVQCIETYIKHKIKNGFYGYNHKATWCENLFFSSQFRKSNVKIEKRKIVEFVRLLKKYEMDKIITKKDKFYLYVIYKILL